MLQKFDRRNGSIVRAFASGGRARESFIVDLSDGDQEPQAAWWQSLLRGARVEYQPEGNPLTIVDAFCGSGGLALGVQLAAEAIGVSTDFLAAIDTDAAATLIHSRNLKSRLQITTSTASLVDFHVWGQGTDAKFGYAPEIVSSELQNIKRTDLLIAGPPCQGHSNLNNHTRRQDPRNDLYVTAVALGVALDAKAIVIENVPTVQNSHSEVVATAVALLRSSGYGVSISMLRADNLGAAQTRKRHFLLAIKGRGLAASHLVDFARELEAPARPLSWAIGDLVKRTGSSLMDMSPTPTPVNSARIDYLFDNNIHDLPDAQRPDCHKGGTSYTAVYGRMHWDKPAQTITTGFGTPGQGRYVHPHERRVITPREAARIQGFPDWFDFAPEGLALKRKHLAKWIGDAVHPMLGYAVGLAALHHLY